MATIEKYLTKAGETRYMVRYRKPDHGQTKKRGYRTKRDAKAAAVLLEAGKLRGEYIAPTDGRVKVDDIARAWLGRRVHTKPSWRERQESIYRTHIAAKWGARPVASIRRPEIRDWIAGLNRAPSTIADIHGVLAAILDEAVDERRIPANPARGISLPRRGLVEHNYLTHGQVLDLVDEVSRYPEIVMLLAYSGMRWGEMAALRPRDVDLDAGRIQVARSASKVNSDSVIVAPKTWERRVVAIPPDVAEVLGPVVEATRSGDALLWSRPDGTPLRPPTTSHWFGQAVGRLVERRQGFPRITAHELRHTAASLMIAAGAHVKTVQRQLGHKSAVMTLDQYGHLFADDLDSVADVMGDALRSARAARECAQNVPTGPLRIVPSA